MINRKGSIKAKQILDEYGLHDLRNFLLEDLIFGRGATIQYAKIDGAEGRIMFSEDEAIITINSSIENEGKKRFVLAHELGHYEMHRDIYPAFSDNEKTLSEWHKAGTHEFEANDFAKELLMPKAAFQPLSKGKFGIELIQKLSSQFQTSLTATLLRYKDIGDYPIAIIYVEKGNVRWTQFTHDFVLQWMPIGSKVRPGTMAYDIVFNKLKPEEEAVKVDAVDWFPEDLKIERYKNWQFYEYCINVSRDGLLVCLWGF